MPDYCQGFGGNRAENSDGRRSAKRDEDTSNGEFQVNSEKRDTFKKILFPVITAAAVVASALIAAFLPSAVWLLFLRKLGRTCIFRAALKMLSTKVCARGIRKACCAAR